MESLTINLHNGFTAYQGEEGEWLYKASPLSPLKKKVKEEPAYKVITEIDREYEEEFQKMLVGVVKDITKLLMYDKNK